MSCPDEATLLRYADAELAGVALRDLEAHLVGCRDCRVRTVALQSESLWLGDVLQERTRHAPLHAPVPEPEASAAWGVPIAVAVLTLATAVGGTLLESQLPGGLDLLNPLRLLGATKMAFNVVFMLRERAPGLFDLALAMAGVASVSALLSFAVGALYRRVFGAAALLLCCLLAPLRGSAFELRHVHEGDIRIGAGETVAGTLVVSSETLHMDGVVDGDLIVTCERVQLAGTVRGNLFVFARSLELTGRVEGSVVGLVEQTDLDGSVAGSVYIASERVRVGPTGALGRDLMLFTTESLLIGKIARDVVFAGDRIEVRGEIGRDLQARWRVERVTLLDSARIGRDVDVWLAAPDDLVRAEGAQIGGELRRHEVESARSRYLGIYRDPWFWALHAVGLVAAFLFGLLVHAFAPWLLDFELRSARSFFATLGLGFGALVATPLAMLLLALTLVCIPIALLGLGAWLTAFYLSEIVIAAALGRRMLPPRDASTWAFGRTLLAGLAVLIVAQHIPFVGIPIWVITVLVGFGVLAAKARDAFTAARERAPT